MSDLKKYLKKAEADPGFKARLIRNANQAIKDEFGEDLPYKLKCCKKLVFEVESMDGSNDEDFKGVAGGSPLPGFGRQTIPPGYVLFNPKNFPLKSTVGPNYISYKDSSGKHHTYNIKEIEGYKYVNTGNLNDEDLEGVSGGTTMDLIPLDLWAEGTEAAGYTLSTQIRKGDTGIWNYYDVDDSGMRQFNTVRLVKIKGEWYAQVE